MTAGKLSLREDLSLQAILSCPNEIDEWKRTDLPIDEQALQNALILRSCGNDRTRVWPLLVDPHNQAELWIRALHEGQCPKLTYTRPVGWKITFRLFYKKTKIKLTAWCTIFIWHACACIFDTMMVLIWCSANGNLFVSGEIITIRCQSYCWRTWTPTLCCELFHFVAGGWTRAAFSMRAKTEANLDLLERIFPPLATAPATALPQTLIGSFRFLWLTLLIWVISLVL